MISTPATPTAAALASGPSTPRAEDVPLPAAAVAQLRQQGFLVQPLLSLEEARLAREAAFRLVAPPYERRTEPAVGQAFFPWDEEGLNAVPLHPRLWAWGRQLLGPTARLRTGYVWVKYADGAYDTGVHTDFANNTLGPDLGEEDDFQHLSILVYLDAVDAGLAPILMVPNGAPDHATVPVTGPAGTACIYSMFTRHTASTFRDPGHRVAMWVNIARWDRPWDHALRFKVHTPREQAAMRRIIAQATPSQREVLGFPPPGDPVWTPRFLAGMVRRYPGFDPAPYAVRPDATADPVVRG